MNKHAQLAIRALERFRGDDLHHARSAFRTCTPEQMQEQFGRSGKTRAEILAEYEARDAEVNAAIEWIRDGAGMSEFPKSRYVARIGDMGEGATLRVDLDSDSDVIVSVHNNTDAGPSVEFCTTGNGGGKSSRTREALIALMVAIEADNAESPDHDWWAIRMRKKEAQKP